MFALCVCFSMCEFMCEASTAARTYACIHASTPARARAHMLAKQRHKRVRAYAHTCNTNESAHMKIHAEVSQPVRLWKKRPAPCGSATLVVSL